MNNVIDFQSNKAVLERKKLEIINMVIDEPNMEVFFKAAFERCLLDKPLHYFKTNEQFLINIISELHNSDDLIHSQLLQRINDVF